MKTRADHAVAVISGASSGIGAACARSLAREGFRLALGARRVKKMDTMVGTLKDLGAPDVQVFELDVTKQASVDKFADGVLKAFGQIDVLINNAGLAAGLDPVVTGRDDDWQAMLDTNVYGLLRLTRRLLPEMIKRDRGHIVNMGSIAGFHTYANGAVYAGTKHAVKAISGALRLELSGTAIRVTEIDPGMVETEFSEVRLKDAGRAKAVYQGMTPLTGDDIADCVTFAVTRPAHVNLDHIIVMPTAQASVYKVHRT
jgi:3-hydroxy acid dehydrogenase/malonic semialdehyde reductase